MRLPIAFAALALAACGRPVDPPPSPEAAAKIGEPETLPRVLPPPNPTQPRYLGRWAVNVDQCDDPPWRFEAERVATQGEVSCDFTSVAQTPTGYRIAASCTSQGASAPREIQLSFAESARAMMVSGGPWSAPIGLVYCGPLDAS